MSINATSTSTVAGIVPAEYIDKVMSEFAHNYEVAMACTRIEQMPELSGVTYQIPYVTADTAASIAENAGATAATAFDVGARDITVGTAGLVYTVSELAQRQNSLGPLGLIDLVARSAAQFCMTLMETDLIALFVGYSNYVGESGTDLSYANFIAGKYKLETGLAHGRPVAVLHPVQVSDLRTSLLTVTGLTLGNPNRGAGVLNDRNFLDQYAGNQDGVDVFYSSLVATANTGADRCGAMFIDSNKANGSPAYAGIAGAVAWMPRARVSEAATAVADSVTVTCAYGFAEVADAYGSAVITDA